MNWIKSILTFACLASCMAPLSADNDIDINDMSTETVTPSQNSPLSFSVESDYVSPTKIKKGFFKGDELKFAEAEAELGFIFYYCPQYKEGANVALSYTDTLLHWEENLWFTQSRFHTLTLSLGGFSHRLCNWFWRGQFSLNVDTEEWSSEYAFYDLLLWGRYEYRNDIGVHIGLVAQAGLYMERLYPLLGIDWQISERWKLNLVFPVNISLEYRMTPKWTFLLAGRNFTSRHRAKQDHSARAYSHRSHEPVWRYQNIGIELGAKYETCLITFNVHAGSTLNGQLRVANYHNHHPHHFKLRGSGYAGANATVNF